MNEHSPYRTPLPQGPPLIPHAAMGDPVMVKIFAILHLVFAGLGILGAAWGLWIAIAGNPFLKFAERQGLKDPQFQAQMAMEKRIAPMTIAGGVLSFVVAVPMIVAGVRMLQKKRDGLKWSNRYAFTSLGAKAVNLVLTFTIMLPAMREMTKMIGGSTSPPGGVEEMMSMAMIFGALGGLLATCVYPVATLVVLNRPAIKEWFARQEAI